jgi:hypothetical protein
MKHLNSYKTFESMQRDNCERCGGDTERMTTMSMFNQDVICMGCKDAEKNHPKYKDAHEADNAAIKSGDYNFKGIGKPDDL